MEGQNGNFARYEKPLKIGLVALIVISVALIAVFGFIIPAVQGADQPTHDAAVASAQAWVKAQVPELEIPIQEEDFENTCWFGVDGEI